MNLRLIGTNSRNSRECLCEDFCSLERTNFHLSNGARMCDVGGQQVGSLYLYSVLANFVWGRAAEEQQRETDTMTTTKQTEAKHTEKIIQQQIQKIVDDISVVVKWMAAYFYD